MDGEKKQEEIDGCVQRSRMRRCWVGVTDRDCSETRGIELRVLGYNSVVKFVLNSANPVANMC